jgi:hypothetical protein
VQHVAVPPTALPESVPPAHDPVLDVAPSLKPRLMRPSRRMPSARERHWQRAALIASIATLAAMLGYAIAANMHPASPLPASLMQNGAQQQVPFGPARMDVSSAGRSAALPRTGKPALSATEGARQGAGVSSTTPKPSAATRAPRRQNQKDRLPPSLSENKKPRPRRGFVFAEACSLKPAAYLIATSFFTSSE